MGKKIQCGFCKDVMESKHRHDMVWCKCSNLAIDGGNDYLKISFVINNWRYYIESSDIPVEYVENSEDILDEEGYLVSSK